MASLNENMKRLRLEKGMTLADVGEKIGVRNATVQRYESGEIKNIKHETIVKLATLFGVTPSELMGWKATTPAAPAPRPQKKGVRIPVFSSIPAGIPIEAVEDIIDYEEINAELARTGEFLALLIRDESMQPVLFVDDVVIVRKQATAETGDIAVILIDGDAATVKKVHRNHGGVMLIGYNAAIYEPHFYTNDEIESLPVQILGKVIELRRKL